MFRSARRRLSIPIVFVAVSGWIWAEGTELVLAVVVNGPTGDSFFQTTGSRSTKWSWPGGVKASFEQARKSKVDAEAEQIAQALSDTLKTEASPEVKDVIRQYVRKRDLQDLVLCSVGFGESSRDRLFRPVLELRLTPQNADS